jgi:hypothetical protein
MWVSRLPVVTKIADWPYLVWPRKVWEFDAERIASIATWMSPDVAF